MNLKCSLPSVSSPLQCTTLETNLGHHSLSSVLLSRCIPLWSCENSAMELATRTSLGFRCLGASTSGRMPAFHCKTPSLGRFSTPNFGNLQSQNSFAARCRPPLIVAAKKQQPEEPASKPKIPSAADSENPIGEQPVKDDKKASETVTVTREQVLKACVNTSVAIGATGLAIRQATHYAVEANWSIPDCYVGMPYSFELWHLGATAGTVVLVASLRQILLSTWPEFSQSSRQSTKQILGPLQLNDYLVVSFLPGISEELLFRGAILPLVGADWRGVTVAGLIFGVLHITGNRNAAFAAWASFVGIVYGFVAISTADLAVPMVAHSLANLVAAYAWRIQEDNDLKKSK